MDEGGEGSEWEMGREKDRDGKKWNEEREEREKERESVTEENGCICTHADTEYCPLLIVL